MFALRIFDYSKMRSFILSPTILSLAAIFLSIQAGPAFPSASLGEPIVLERLNAIPHGWHQKTPPPASKRLRFRIALKQENAFAFEQHVIDISSPGHPSYGQHMDHADLKRMLQPSSEASEAVLTWLQSRGIQSEDIEDDGDWINFSAPTVEAERILDTKFHYYSNPVSNIERIRTLHYSIPAALHKYVQMIQPTTRFGQIKAQRSNVYEHFEIGPQRGPSTYHGSHLNVTFCNTTITPQCIKALYNYGNFKASAHNGNKIGVCGYLKEYAKFKDFAQFTSKYAPYAANENFTYVLINGGLATQDDTVDDDVEANLDAQYAYPLSYPTPGIYYSTGGLGELVPDLDQPTQADDQNEPYLDFLHYILKLPAHQLPQTLTTSYGEDEQSVPEACKYCHLVPFDKIEHSSPFNMQTRKAIHIVEPSKQAVASDSFSTSLVD